MFESKYYEIDNYEADDIIGTFATYCEKDPEFEGLIISANFITIDNNGVGYNIYTPNPYAFKEGEEYIARVFLIHHYWNGRTEKSFIFEKNGVEFAFAEEGPLAADTLGFWNDQNWCGSNVVIIK